MDILETQQRIFDKADFTIPSMEHVSSHAGAAEELAQAPIIDVRYVAR